MGIKLQTDYHLCDEILLLMEQNGKHFFLCGHYFLFLEYSGLFHSFVQHGGSVGFLLSTFIYWPSSGGTSATLDLSWSSSHAWWPSSRGVAMAFRVLIASQESLFIEKYGNDNKHVDQSF